MRRLAVMRGIHFGVRDIGRACLAFEADEGDMSSLQVLMAKEAIEMIEKHQIVDITELEGHPCWVESDGQAAGGIARFVDLHVRKRS